MKRITVGLLAGLLPALLWGGAAGAAEAPAAVEGEPITPPVQPKITPAPLPPPIVLPPPPALPADVTSAPLTADEAALIALRRQPNVAVARANVVAAQGVTRQARSALGPTVGVGAGWNSVTSLSGGSGGGAAVGSSGGGSVVTTSGYQESLAARQLIFDFNHTRSLVRQSQAQERSTVFNLTRTQSDLVLSVKQAFYTLTQDERLITVNETNLRNQEAHLALAQARLAAGVGLPLDVVRAQTAVADAALNLNVARTNAGIARVNLATLMGVDPRTPITPAPSTEPPIATDDVNALATDALRRRPEILQALATIQATDFGVRAARTTNAPSFAANVGLASRGQSFPTKNNSFSFGLTVGFNIFDSGLQKGRVEQARANAEAARSQLAGVQQTVISDVSQAYLNLRTAEQRVTTADAEVANAEESVRLATGRWRAGVGIFLDVLDAQAALVTAETNRVNAEALVQQARAALSRAIGTPLPGTAAPGVPAPGPLVIPPLAVSTTGAAATAPTPSVTGAPAAPKPAVAPKPKPVPGGK